MSRDDRDTLPGLLVDAIRGSLALVYTAIPARVESYDAALQQISAQPLIQASYAGEDGVRRHERLPPVTNVPVLMPGGGSMRITFPVEIGDTVWLVFSMLSLDEWLSGGQESTPVSDRRHSLSDAVAITGLRPAPRALGDSPTDRISMGTDGGVTIEVGGAKISLGSWAASEEIVTKSDLDAVTAIYNGHGHSSLGAPPAQQVLPTTVKGAKYVRVERNT